MRVLACLASTVNKLPASRHLVTPLRYCSVPVRLISQVPSNGRKVPTKFTKTHQLDTSGLAELRYVLARDHLKQYTEGDKRQEVLDLALADNKAARNMKVDAKYFLQLLEILCAAEKFQQLIDEVDANIFTFSYNTTLLEYRAYAFMRLRNFKKALEDTEYILLNSRSEDRVMDSEELYMQKADCQIELGEHEAAFKTIKHCLQNGIVLDKALQVVVDKLDNASDALELLNAEIATHKEPSAELLLCRASLHVAQGNAELALADYNLAPESERKKEFYVEYGNILGKLGRFEEEINILQSVLDSKTSTTAELREYIIQKQHALFQFRNVRETSQYVKQGTFVGKNPATRYFAESLLFLGDYEGAIKFFNQSLEETRKKEMRNEEEEEEDDDDDTSDVFVLTGKQRSHFLRAVCQVALGNPHAALEDLETLTHPILAKKTLENLLVAKSTSKKLSDAEYDALQTAGIEYNTGLYKKNKNNGEAEIHFTNALKCNVLNYFPFHVLKLNILLARASNYEPLRRFTESLEDCEAALQILTCDSKQILSLQQSCLSTVERYDEIAKIIQKYHLLNDPLDIEGPHLALALAYAGTRPVYQKAYEELQKCEHKATHEWQKLLCTVTHELFKPEETISAVNDFIQRHDITDEERGFALLLRAENVVRTLLKKDKYKSPETKTHLPTIVHRILLDIQRSIELYPESKEDAIKLRAHTYFTFTTRYDEALNSFAAMADKMASNIGIAQCLKAIGRTEEATRHLETLLKGTETLSEDGGIMAFRGSVFYHLGKYEAAIENYSRGIVIRANDDEFVANCYQQRAEAYIQLGDRKQAENDLKKAAELNPNRKEEYAQLIELQFTNEEGDNIQIV